MTLNTAITFTTKLDGSGLDQLKRQLQSLSQQSNITKQSLGQANIDINRMAREAGNTTNGLRTHIGALKNLRDNVDINSQAYRRLGNEIKGLESKLQGLDRVSNKVNVGRQAIGAAGGALALGGGAAGAFGAAGGVLAATGPAGMLAAGVGAAAVGVAASSFGAAKELNDQERKLATLTVQSSGLTNAIRLLVAEQGFLTSSAESASAAYEILSSGYIKQSDVLSILKASTLGATGGFSDIKTVADATTTILNSFSLSADNANQIVDGMIQTQNDGKIVVSQYADQIAKVASVAAAAGLSVEEMNASIAAITATGVSAETAMSGLRQALINVIKPTDQARELAKKIGLEFSLAAIQTKGWAGFLKDATDKTDGSAEALSILFGDIDGFNAILKLTGPNMGRFNDFLDNQEKKLGAAAKAAKQAKDPFKQFDIAVTELNTSIGKIFLPTLTKLITQVTTFFQIISSDKNKKAVQDYGNSIRGLGIAGGGNIYSGNVPQSERIDALNEQERRAIQAGPIGPPVPERLKKPPQRQLRAPGAGTVNQEMADLANQIRQGGGGSGDEEKRRQAENRYKQIANNNQKQADARQIHALEVINLLKAESVAFEAQRTKTNELEINKLILRNQLDVVFLENEKDRINLTLKYVNAKEKAKTIEDATARNLELQNVENEGLSDNQKLILDLKTKEQSINSDFLKTEKNRREEKEKYLTQLDKEIQMLGDAEQQELAIANLKLRYRRDPRALEAELQDLGIRQRYEKRASTLIEDLTKEGITGKEASQRIQNLDKELDKALQGAEAIRALKRSIDELNAADVGQGFKNGVESFLTSIGTMSENVSQLTQNAFQGLSDGITELVTTGKMNFNDFANSIIKDMIRIATQQLILRPILQGIGGLFGGGPGGGGLPGFGIDSIIPGLGLGNTPAFKFAGGGIMTSQGPMPLKRYAAGGIANSPQLAMYGEGRMPEAYVPLPDGRRIPVAMQGGGGATSVVVNVDATGSKVEGDAPRGDQLGKALSAAVQAELIKQRRPGGLLA
jgi:TP901 family phage tail tape measure protein/lambda family phage tail tape measure protein